MGLLKIVGKGIKNLISDDPTQYVNSERPFDNELVIAMNNTGDSNITSADAAELLKSYRDANKGAQNMAESQANSIQLHPSELIIRAKNFWEKWIKEIRFKKQMPNILSKNQKYVDLPKDDTIRMVEETNVVVENARELGNNPREKGGKDREKSE